MKLSVCFDACSRPILSRIVLERAKDILENYDYEFTMMYGRIPERPHDEIVEIAKSLFDVKNVIMSERFPYRGIYFNRAFSMSSGDYHIFLENDFYWREDRIEDAIKALDDVQFVLMLKTPFSNFSEIKSGFYIQPQGTDYAYNFGPSIRKELFPIGMFREDLGSAQLEKHSSNVFNEMGKRAAVLDTDSLSHIGFINSNGVLREQHFIREGIKPSLIEAVKCFKSISKDRSHVDLFIEHLQTEIRGADKGVELEECIDENNIH